MNEPRRIDPPWALGALDVAPVGMAVLLDERIEYVNKRICDLLGYEAQDLRGQPARTFTVSEPEYERLRDRIDPLSSSSLEGQLRRQDGSLVDVLISAAALEADTGERFLLSVVDITERRQAEQDLSASESLYRSLVDQAAQMLFFHDMEGNIVDVNRAAVVQTGYSCQELLDMSAADIDPDYVRREAGGSFWDGLGDDQPTTFEGRHQRKDGALYPVEVTLSQVEYSGKQYILALARDITDRQAYEQTLKEYTAMLAKAEELADIGSFVWDLRDDALTWSDNMYTLAGLDADTFAGNLSQISQQIIHPDDQVMVAQQVEEMARSGRTWPMEFRIIRPDDQIRWWRSGSEFITDDQGRPLVALGLHRDITEEKEAAAQLRASEARLLAAQRLARLGSWVHDVQSDSDSWSDEVFRIHGLDPNQDVPPLEKRVTLLVPEDRAPFLAAFEKAVNEGEGYHLELRLALPGGESRTLETICEAERNQEGQVVRLVGAIQDISDRVRIQQELEQYSELLEELVAKRTAALREAQEQLVRREKLAFLGQLAGSVGHELRNPLGVINNAVYLLNMIHAGADETTREYLGLIEAEVRNSERIVADLLDFARVKSVNRQPVPIASAVRDMLERCPAPEGVTVRQRIADDLPPAYVDARHLEQILVNLVSNAYDAMSEGGTLTLAATPAGEDGGAPEWISLSVSDTGCGISQENLPRLFEPLFTTKARGIGLGLAITKNLIESNDGSIVVESTEGQGTTFVLTMPIARS